MGIRGISHHSIRFVDQPPRLYGDIVRGLRLDDSPRELDAAFRRHRADGHRQENCQACARFARCMSRAAENER